MHPARHPIDVHWINEGGLNGQRFSAGRPSRWHEIKFLKPLNRSMLYKNYPIDSQTVLWGGYHRDTHLADEETKAERNHITHPGPCGKLAPPRTHGITFLLNGRLNSQTKRKMEICHFKKPCWLSPGKEWVPRWDAWQWGEGFPLGEE